MIGQLLGLPITGPIAGFNFIMRQLLEMAERELYDPERIREEILLAQMRLEQGEITEEEYKELEGPLMERWRAVHDYWQTKGK